MTRLELVGSPGLSLYDQAHPHPCALVGQPGGRSAEVLDELCRRREQVFDVREDVNLGRRRGLEALEHDRVGFRQSLLVDRVGDLELLLHGKDVLAESAAHRVQLSLGHLSGEDNFLGDVGEDIVVGDGRS